MGFYWCLLKCWLFNWCFSWSLLEIAAFYFCMLDIGLYLCLLESIRSYSCFSESVGFYLVFVGECWVFTHGGSVSYWLLTGIVVLWGELPLYSGAPLHVWSEPQQAEVLQAASDLAFYSGSPSAAYTHPLGPTNQRALSSTTPVLFEVIYTLTAVH